MRLFRRFENVAAPFQGAVLAAGDFDGVHLGHRALIQEAKRVARQRNRPLGVLTFEPSRPHGEAEYFRLTPLRVQARLFAELGVDVLFALPFDDARAGGDTDILGSNARIRIKPCAILVAHDCRPAQPGPLGDTEVIVVASPGPEQITAPGIREALKNANPGEAARLLGRCWALEMRVRHGDARGRTMSFPTANTWPNRVLSPAPGIYAVRANILSGGRVEARRDGVANFGIRPMYRAATPLLETHLFDFDGDLYGKYLSVELVAWLRPEGHFSSPAQLVRQMRHDAAAARAVLAANPDRLQLGSFD